MKVQFSPISFMVAFCCTYAIVFWFNWPMFLYYPQTGTWYWGPTAMTNAVGPSMAWYGLMANAGVVAAIAAVLVPNRSLDAPLRNLFWLFPIGAMLTCVYLLRVFFR